MVRVIGLYRWLDGATFDHEYYNSKHMQLTLKLLSPRGLVRLESDRYLAAAPPIAGDIIAASNAYFPSIEAARAALTAAGGELMADVPKYTTLRPQLHFVAVTSHC